MNKKTSLSKVHGLMFKWKKYVKQFSNNYKHWAIISDYCIDEKTKPNKVLTFSICPYDVNNLKLFMSKIQQNMRYDIKHKKTIPASIIELIKNQKFFFTISYVLREDNYIDVEQFKSSLDNYIKRCEVSYTQNHCEDTSKNIKQLKQIQQFMNKKNFNHKFIKYFIYVASMLAEVMEFLTINQGAETINWISDRDPVLTFSNGVFYTYASILYNTKIKGRRNNITNILYNSFSEHGDFPLDGLIRFPDTITAVLASLNFDNNQFNDKKHCILMENAIVENDKIVVLDITSTKIREILFTINTKLV